MSVSTVFVCVYISCRYVWCLIDMSKEDTECPVLLLPTSSFLWGRVSPWIWSLQQGPASFQGYRCLREHAQLLQEFWEAFVLFNKHSFILSPPTRETYCKTHYKLPTDLQFHLFLWSLAIRGTYTLASEKNTGKIFTLDLWVHRWTPVQLWSDLNL